MVPSSALDHFRHFQRKAPLLNTLRHIPIHTLMTCPQGLALVTERRKKNVRHMAGQACRILLPHFHALALHLESITR